MERQDWRFAIRQKSPRKFSIFTCWKNFRGQINDIDPKLLQRLCELPRRRRVLIDLDRTAQDFLRTALSQIVFEDLIRIVEIAENQIETAEIISQLRRKVGISRKEA